MRDNLVLKPILCGVRQLIVEARQKAALMVNAGLSRLFPHVGKHIGR